MLSIDPSTLKVAELRTELSNRNLSTKGKKEELVARLTEAIEKENNTNDEQVVEKPSEDVIETPQEKVVEKPVEEVAEELIEKSDEKPEEQVIKKPEEQMTKKPKEQVIEKPKEAVIEKPKEEMIEKPKEVVIEKPKEESTPNESMDTDRNSKKRRSVDAVDKVEGKRIKVDTDNKNKVESSALYVNGFIRPLIIRSVQELLGKYGNIKRFWMDSIKTHCYVIYETDQEAKAAFDNINGIVFPQDTGKALTVGGLTPEQVEQLIEHEQYAAEKRLRVEWEPLVQKIKNGESLPSSPASENMRKARSIGMGQIAKQLAQAAEPVVPTSRQMNIEAPRERKERSLDDLFCKTKALPQLYYLPNSDQEAKIKLKEIQSTI